MQIELNTTNTTNNKNNVSLISGETCSRVLRFKFNDDFVKELYNFSKIHQYDDRVSFKEAWNIWTQDHDENIYTEINRLNRLGYDGDIKDKMFKSARYYFRKKTTEKKEPVKRREYINVSKDLLEQMDLHIKSHITDAEYTPKNGFNEFCIENSSILKESIKKICEDGITELSVIYDKIKKTYKNRYFMLTNK
jgi:hypothetical protein